MLISLSSKDKMHTFIVTMIDIKLYYFHVIIWFFTCLIILYFLKKFTKARANSSFHLPPSPPSLPLLGHVHLLRKDMHICFQNIALKYGPLLYLRFGSHKFTLVSSASIATEVFKLHDIAISSKPPSVFEDRLIFGNAGFIFSPYGDYWRYMKKLTVTELLGARQLQRSYNVRKEERHNFLHRIFKAATKSAVDAVDVRFELLKLTNNTICRMAMSTRCSEDENEAEKVKELVDGSFELAIKLVLASMAGPLKGVGKWIYGKQDKEMKRKCDELLEKLWEEHESRAKKQQGQGGFDREDRDLMDCLLEAYHDDKAAFKLSRNQIKAFILDLFIVGSSTTKDEMEWVLANLINHPQVLQKLREEIERVVGNNRLIEENDIDNMPYLQAVVKETLRLYPSSGPIMPRRTSQNFKLMGFDVEKDSVLVFNLYAINRDPQAWNNPNDFLPERFMASNRDDALNFMTFGAGRRMCPGSTLALTMLNTTIACMVQCFDWKLVGRDQVNMRGRAGFGLELSEPLLCCPIIRFNPFSK